jgi:hypothetical protein
VQQLKKIEERTDWFIDAYNMLEKEKRLPSNVELAAIMGMGSKSTVTNILKKQQNIQPEQWRKFKDHFGVEDGQSRSEDSEREPTMMEILAGLTEGFKAIASTMRSMESKMALESSLQEVLAGVETISDRQGPAIQKILADLDELKRRKSDP